MHIIIFIIVVLNTCNTSEATYDLQCITPTEYTDLRAFIMLKTYGEKIFNTPTHPHKSRMVWSHTALTACAHIYV